MSRPRAKHACYTGTTVEGQRILISHEPWEDCAVRCKRRHRKVACRHTKVFCCSRCDRELDERDKSHAP